MTPAWDAALQGLLGQDRIWNCTQLAQTLHLEMGVLLSRETIRVRLLALGYCFKRGRIAPGKAVDPATLSAYQADQDTLKKGHWTAN